MTKTGLAGSDLRERKHLDPFMKDAFEAATGIRPVSKRFNSGSFVGLGAVDVVANTPALFMELKWSYERPGKIFESVWDAIKLAVLGPEHDRDRLYIATGASEEEWTNGDCAELFTDGTHGLLDMWRRRLVPKRGPNYGETVGEDLVIGSRGNQPAAGPKTINVRPLDSFGVAREFVLKVVAVTSASELQNWPQISPE
jgi:hypothetical protein